MMQLKNLFDNRDLALMLLGNWHYDKDKINYMDDFRISSNAVYPFMIEGCIHFLRFAPIEEKREADLMAELDFVSYLSDSNYSVANIAKTQDDQRYVKKSTPWGEYLAVVFKGVEGKQVEAFPYSNELYYGFGKSLGQLHKLSQAYTPSSVVRPNWEERLRLTKEILLQYKAPSNAVKEVDILWEYLSSVTIDSTNFGLIHYDFELDNVFYNDAKKQFNIIDFDDAVYHWYGMDVLQSLDSIREEISIEFHQQAEQSFISGYTSLMDLDEEMRRLFPVFRRYAYVFSYARCLRSIHVSWEHEPEWMVKLRKRVLTYMEKRQALFGSKIVI